MFRYIRLGRRAIGGTMLIVSLIAFLSSNQFSALKLAFNFWDPLSISQYRLTHLSKKRYQNAIEQALKDDEMDDAQTLVQMAQEHGYKIPKEIIDRTIENPLEYTYRYSTGFLNGAFYGNVTNTPSLAGSITSDLCLIGDVRDTLTQGSRLIEGSEYERITLALAVLGIATSVALPIDIGLSIMKATNKIGKLSKPLVKHIRIISSKMIDINILKKSISQLKLIKLKTPSIPDIGISFNKIEWSQVARGDLSKVERAISELMPIDASAVKGAVKDAVHMPDAKEVTALAGAVGGIASSGGFKAAMRALEHADDAKELSRFNSLAKSMGKKTSVVIKVLGKGAIKLGKLIYLVIFVLIAVSGWVLYALWFLYSIIRSIYRATKWAKAVT